MNLRPGFWFDMQLIDFILNIAGLLLWLNWRSGGVDPFASGKPSTISGTVRRAQPRRVQRWHHPSALAAMFILRAVFYWKTGAALNWIPRLDLYFATLSFHAAFFLPMLTFSLLSFSRALLIMYFWLLTLAAINRRSAGADPFQKMISLQLGRLARWPWPAQLLLPMLSAALCWLALNPLLIRAGIAARAQSDFHLAGQCLLVGAALVLSLKFLLPTFLVIDLVASYVFFGKSPLLDFVELTARNILAPLNRVPLSVGRMDFAPLVMLALILLLFEAIPDYVLAYLSRRGFTVWPP